MGRMLGAVPHTQLHRLGNSVKSADEAERLIRSLDALPREEGEAPDARLIRWASLRLRGGAGPMTVLGYIGRMVAELRRRGRLGYRTMKVHAVKRTLRRFAAVLRPRQAVAISPPQVIQTVESLERSGQPMLAAWVAMTWVLRARLSDGRYICVEDVREVVAQNDADANVVGAEVVLREKVSLEWRPPSYLPPGRLSARFIRWYRRVKTTGGRTLFTPTDAEYEAARRRIRQALPPGAWLYSLRRGAIQHLQETFGLDVEEAGDLLRHKHPSRPANTRRYLATTLEATRKTHTKYAAALQ
eukprot:TRINITY_DN4589_c0_g1_i2.p2 TRINITY_DN4589_c0_g1~~TRINITY_DN4589_c0_g1_i2.p2  ORF type:complete len:300 (-),score=11.57 TRINITY_DN4589_c0_g1_i2:2210-3109(-)